MSPRSLVLTVLMCAAAAGRSAAHGGLEEETARLDAAVMQSPQDAGIRFERSCLFLSFGEWRRALQDAAQVEALAPGKYPVAFVRGRALAGAGEPAAALVELNAFLSAHPGHPPALVARGRVLIKLNRTMEAVTDYRSALARAAVPEPDLFLELTDILAAEKRPAEAAAVLEEGITRLGRIPSLETRAIELAAGQGLTDDALKRVDRMQAAAPRPEPWMARRAEILAAAGRTAEAQQAWLALSHHLAALPEQVRRSHAMCLLAERAAGQILSSVPVAKASSSDQPQPAQSP